MTPDDWTGIITSGLRGRSRPVPPALTGLTENDVIFIISSIYSTLLQAVN